MDLPTCPHCGESVLDDDVDDCPFCGESMSGPSSAPKKSASQPAPAPEKPAQTPAQEKPKRRKVKKKAAPAKSSGDEPFAVDQAALSNAVALRSKPTKGRTYKVVCPMCETAGYTSPKAGGREVKCANAECLVPIFTCPEPPPAPVEEGPPEPEGLSTTQLGLFSAIALVLVGFGIWFFVLRKDPDDASSKTNNNTLAKTDNSNKKTESPKTTVVPENVPPTAPEGPDLVSLRKQAPERMLAATTLPSGRDIKRPKALRVQWTALALADLGELKQAEEQIERLPGVDDYSPHYRVLPWVEVGWKRLEREESPDAAIEKALESAKDEPPSLQESWTEAVSLAALLTAVDRIDEAESVLQRKLGRRQDQELWSDLANVALDHSFDLDALEPARPLVTPQNPAWSGVVWQLVFHDAPDKALAWAARAADPAVRSEALVALADAAAAKAIATGKPWEDPGLDAAIEKTPADWSLITKVRANSRIGQRFFLAKDSQAAEPFLAKAKSAAQFPQEQAMVQPDLKSIYRGGFDPPPTNHPTAIAAFELARLQAQLGKTDEAWNSIEAGLSVLRSETLSRRTASELVRETKALANSLRFQLKNALSLSTDDETRRAYREYQKHVNELLSDAETRLTLQAELLSEAVAWNLSDRLLEEIEASQTSEAGDSYLVTRFPWKLAAHLRDHNQADKAAALENQLRRVGQTRPQEFSLLEDAKRAVAAGNLSKLTEALGRGSSAIPDPVRRRWILRFIGRLVLAERLRDAFGLLLAIYKLDPFLGEDATGLSAGLATVNGQGQAIWDEFEQTRWSATQKIAAYLGFVQAATPLGEEESETNEESP